MVKVYWWNAVPNFGDRLTPLLISRFAGLEAEWAPADSAQLFAVGSIVEHIPGTDAIILGSGKLLEETVLKGIYRKNILALRGPLTARGVRGDYALGDAGLLASELVVCTTKKYDLGIISHWSDVELNKNPIFAQFKPKLIDPRGDPLEVIKAISECRKIVSSSLHGLIIADAFGIPRRFEYTKQFDREGGMFKFNDYSASIGSTMEVGKLITPNYNRVDDRKYELFDAFVELGTIL
jgi:pyruvyltransferase